MRCCQRRLQLLEAVRSAVADPRVACSWHDRVLFLVKSNCLPQAIQLGISFYQGKALAPYQLPEVRLRQPLTPPTLTVTTGAGAAQDGCAR